MAIDKEGFDAAMAEQRNRARQARVDQDAKVATPDITFLAKENLVEDLATQESKVMMLGEGATRLDSASDGQEVTIILQSTPFHAEGGGQVGDTGFLIGPVGKIEVHNTKRLPEGTVYHIGTVVEGTVYVGDIVTTDVDRVRTMDIARNHTATHLLHAALKSVLGQHVNQAGSLVTPDYLRFDFTHFSTVSQEELAKVEDLVNQEILKATPVTIEEMSMDAAKEKGAMALFGDKYGDVVRVVSVPGFSIELCGGSHVENTGFIGSFRIVGEQGTGSGVRRIEAFTGRAALTAALADRALVQDVADTLKTKDDQVVSRLHAVIAEAKGLEKELAEAKKQLASADMGDLMATKQTINCCSSFCSGSAKCR